MDNLIPRGPGYRGLPPDVDPRRVREMQKINASLHALGNVINALTCIHLCCERKCVVYLLTMCVCVCLSSTESYGIRPLPFLTTHDVAAEFLWWQFSHGTHRQPFSNHVLRQRVVGIAAFR